MATKRIDQFPTITPDGTEFVLAQKQADLTYGKTTLAIVSAAAAPVQSVAGRTGAITLSKTDVGLTNVDNTSDAAKPVSTATQTALNLKVNTASLATVATTGSYTDLTSKPTIPTVPTLVSAFTNDSGYLTSASLSTYATQSYVTTAVNSLVNGSPAALDTLKELADALGDDANFASTVTNSLATKAPLSSPSFTGMVTSDNVLRGTDFELTNTNGSYAVNAHYNAGWKYISTGPAFLMNADGSGGMYFYTASSGTAGAAISFTERLHITSSGLIGNGSGLTGIPESAVTNLTTDLAALVAKSGDTMTGALTITTTAVADDLTLDATGAFNTILRVKNNGVERGALYNLNGGNIFTLRAQNVLQLISNQAATGRTINFDASNFAPTANNTLGLGSSSFYWSNLYASRLNLNATAFIDGATAGVAALTGSLTVSGLITGQTGAYTQPSSGGEVNSLQLKNAGGAANSNVALTFIPGNLTVGTAKIVGEAPGGSNTQLSFWTSTANAAPTAKMLIDNAGLVGLGTTAPTHTLTLPSTATGVALHNQIDQTTNYERALTSWVSNVYTINVSRGGTGTVRSLDIGNSNADLFINNTSSGGQFKFQGASSGSATGIWISASPTSTNSSGTFILQSLTPTITQTSTAGYTALLVNPTETSVGNGIKKLIDLQVGGTSKVSVTNDGVFFPVQAPTASAPTYIKGGVYFDTTLNKLRIGGATAWETVTSS